MPKPFLIIQLRPENEVAASELDKIRQYAGLGDHEVERFRIEQAPLPELELNRYSGIIVGGSPYDISTLPQHKSPVQQRIEADFFRLFDEIVPRDFPFLGCCSGSGLLGAYCGASISTKHGEDVGGVDVCVTAAGQADPLVAGLPPTFRVLLGHKEACDATPPGASLLLEGETCPVQMFRVGGNVYATQFHPELDAEGIAVRIQAYKHHGYFPAAEAELLLARLEPESTPHSQQILQRFVARYQT